MKSIYKENGFVSSKLLLFFDTETTGVPRNYSAPISDLDNWPRLIQIGWAIYNSDGSEIDAIEYIIKPDSFIIPTAASKIHGITMGRHPLKRPNLGPKFR